MNCSGSLLTICKCNKCNSYTDLLIPLSLGGRKTGGILLVDQAVPSLVHDRELLLLRYPPQGPTLCQLQPLTSCMCWCRGHPTFLISSCVSRLQLHPLYAALWRWGWDSTHPISSLSAGFLLAPQKESLRRVEGRKGVRHLPPCVGLQFLWHFPCKDPSCWQQPLVPGVVSSASIFLPHLPFSVIGTSSSSDAPPQRPNSQLHMTLLLPACSWDTSTARQRPLLLRGLGHTCAGPLPQVQVLASDHLNLLLCFPSAGGLCYFILPFQSFNLLWPVPWIFPGKITSVSYASLFGTEHYTSTHMLAGSWLPLHMTSSVRNAFFPSSHLEYPIHFHAAAQASLTPRKGSPH